MKAAVYVVVGLAALLAAGLARSATSDVPPSVGRSLDSSSRARPSRPIAHEHLTIAPGDKSPEPIRDAVAPPRPNAAATEPLPDAIDYNGQRIDAPDADATPHDGEPVLRADEPVGPQSAAADPAVDSPLSPPDPSAPPSSVGPATPGLPSPLPAPGPGSPAASHRAPVPTRQDEMRPDGDTSADPVLRYASVFKPSVAPFKRFDVKDRVDADFILRTTAPRRLPIAIGGAPRGLHDRFYGSVLLDASGGALVPIPSVAPDARILRAETSPRRAVQFYRDGASNDFVRIAPAEGASHRAAGSDVVRLNFLTEAPRNYFGGELPEARFEEVPAYARPILPANVARAAEGVLTRLGVGRELGVAVALTKLVTHFRAYVAEDRRHALSGQQLFVRLALGGAGACRHRAYAFVILTQALGLPSRFVANEAHAFAELWLPRVGWRRIDLGGVSPRLEVYSRGERAPHQPGYDPFPRPDAYRTYTRDYKLPSPGPAPSPGEPVAPVEPPPAINPQSSSSAPSAPTNNPVQPTPPDGLPVDGGPANDAAPSNNAVQPKAEPTGPAAVTIELIVAAREALRGDALNVAGRVRTLRGAAAPNVRVDASLVHVEGHDRRRLTLLLTDDVGAFSARLPLPSDLAPGRYTLQVETAADARFQAARASQ